MTGLLAAFHFLRPWWLAALLLAPWVGWTIHRRHAGMRAFAALVDPVLLPTLVRGGGGSARASIPLAVLAWVLAVLALAGPTWSRVPQPLYAQRTAQVVAISLSQRMLARDVAPSRIDRARLKAHGLLDANRSGLNALIGYAGEAFVVAPLTSDVHSLGTLLEAMAPDTMPVDGDDAAAAIRRGVALIRDAKAGGGTIVVITDSANAAADAAARAASAHGVRVSVLGVGTPHGAPVPLPAGGFLHDAAGNLQLAGRDDAALAALAAAGGGRYVPMSADNRDITTLHADLRAGTTQATAGDLHGDAWQDRGPWLLLALLPLAALAFRRGWLVVLALVMLPLATPPAQAATWRDWWQRPDQQAATALRHGDAKRAMQVARDPAWRGAAAYRAGDYAAAARALQGVAGSDAAYNRGNALAREGKFTDAIHAYDAAIKANANNADAVANRKAVEDWLRQQQPPPKPSNGGDQSRPPPSGGDKGGGQGKNQQGDAGKHPPDQQDAGKGAAGQGDGKRGNAPPESKPGTAADGQPREPKAAQGDQPASAATSPAPATSSGMPPKADGGTRTKPAPAPTPAQQAAQQAEAARAQQALKQQLDRQLGTPPRAAHDTPHQLGMPATGDAASKLPADLRNALQRVPDDPGALLRRKFELEYQERHGGVPDQGGQ